MLRGVYMHPSPHHGFSSAHTDNDLEEVGVTLRCVLAQCNSACSSCPLSFTLFNCGNCGRTQTPFRLPGLWAKLCGAWLHLLFLLLSLPPDLSGLPSASFGRKQMTSILSRLLWKASGKLSRCKPPSYIVFAAII